MKRSPVLFFLILLLVPVCLLSAGPACPSAYALEEADTNGDGRVDEGERQWFRRQQKERKAAELRKRLDSNQDGIVDEAELARSNQLEKDSNPPGPKGGKGTDWENPPGPKGGPGASPDKKKVKKRSLFG